MIHYGQYRLHPPPPQKVTFITAPNDGQKCSEMLYEK